ncbi:MAG: hypothetical protein AAGI68_12190 [Planctomycetota bacterium]
MNELGVEGCRRKRDALLDEIWERRDDVKFKGWRNIAKNLPGAKGPALQELGGLFDEAMGSCCDPPDKV